MAERRSTTRAARPPARPPGGGGDKKIMGMDQKTVFIVGGLALGGGLLYFYFKGKQTPQQGQGQGKGQQKRRPASPTGLTREQLVLHIHDHQGHRRGRG